MSRETRIACALGILGIIVVVMQMMFPIIPQFIGWPIVGMLVLGALIVLFVGKKKNQMTIGNGTKKSRKEEAIKIHNKIIALETKLWDTRDKLPDTEDPLKNPEIKHIMDELQTKINDLGHLINNSDYDRWVEVLMEMYSKDLEFNMNMHNSTGMWGRARINSKFRWYINHKIKG